MSRASATGREAGARQRARSLAQQAFTRAAGTPVSEGNQLRLLIDGAENYPAWLEAIRGARRYVQLENYIIHDDEVGRAFADALVATASGGVRVRVIYDWLGCLRTPRAFWRRLRAGGVEARCHNPPRWDAPFAWISRDHRKTLSVDGVVGFVAGLCIGQMWLGDAEKKIGPWRDTGIELRGPAVAQLEEAFSSLWGEPPGGSPGRGSRGRHTVGRGCCGARGSRGPSDGGSASGRPARGRVGHPASVPQRRLLRRQRVVHAVGAAVSERRVVEPAEGRIALSVGLLLAALAALFGFFLGLLAYPLVFVLAWLGLALVSRGVRLLRRRAGAPSEETRR